MSLLNENIHNSLRGTSLLAFSFLFIVASEFFFSSHPNHREVSYYFRMVMEIHSGKNDNTNQNY